MIFWREKKMKFLTLAISIREIPLDHPANNLEVLYVTGDRDVNRRKNEAISKLVYCFANDGEGGGIAERTMAQIVVARFALCPDRINPIIKKSSLRLTSIVSEFANSQWSLPNQKWRMQTSYFYYLLIYFGVGDRIIYSLIKYYWKAVVDLVQSKWMQKIRFISDTNDPVSS